ncbi:transmembrane amino acid transporter [Nitzschia inconspicua]|uniref:Transmembrane amino acid transporter n=1 Tax=Nitzschia inconspicua TaxID=303405 RepID=A0A9K3M3U1_9STRA|nr:transmembrane amino acid transporter [Nitzschia inconspicua]
MSSHSDKTDSIDRLAAFRHEHNGSPTSTDFVALVEGGTIQSTEHSNFIVTTKAAMTTTSSSSNKVSRQNYEKIHGNDQLLEENENHEDSNSNIEITSTTRRNTCEVVENDGHGETDEVIPTTNGDITNDTDNYTYPQHQQQSTMSTTSTTIISWFDASMHLIKGNLGPGCLNIPHAFVLSGWLLGLGLFVMVVAQGIYSMFILVHCKIQLSLRQQQQQQSQSTHHNVHSFMDVAHAAFGRPGSIIIQTLLVVVQLGVCCVFLSLLATNLHAQFPIGSEYCVGLVTFALLGIVLLQNLRDLRWLSTTANVFMVTAIVTATVAAIIELLDTPNNNDNNNNDSERPPPVRATSSFANMATFVSSMFFSFEGIGLVLPIENSYVGSNDDDDHDDDDGNIPSHALSSSSSAAAAASSLQRRRRQYTFQRYILTGSMTVVALLFLCIGIPSSLAFTDITSGSITAYLTETFPQNPWYPFVNTLVMIAVYLTFPLQLTPAMEVLDEWFGPGCDPVCCSGVRDNIRGTACCCDSAHSMLVLRRRRRRPAQRQQQDPEESRRNDTVDNQRHEESPKEDTTRDGILRSNDETNGTDCSVNLTVPIPGVVDEDDVDYEISVDEETLSLPPNRCFGKYEWIFRRYVVVFGCSLVVLVVNNLSLLMSLFGAVGQTGLALMPCAIHLQLQRQGAIVTAGGWMSVLMDGFTILFSLMVMVTGIVFSIQEIITAKRK